MKQKRTNPSRADNWTHVLGHAIYPLVSTIYASRLQLEKKADCSRWSESLASVLRLPAFGARRTGGPLLAGVLQSLQDRSEGRGVLGAVGCWLWSLAERSLVPDL